MAPRQLGKVLTFYSYKGGVGRTMALANVAVLLSRMGRRVLMVDFDLEAPGLEHYFSAVPASSTSQEKDGIVDLFLAWKSGDKLAWRDLCISFTIEKSRGKLDLISAGRDDGTYIRKAQSIQCDALFEDRDISFAQKLLDLRQEWRENYDYIFIDSRTGISDIGGICTILFPDTLVMLFTANTQSVQGCIEVIDRARKAQERLPDMRWRLQALPVLSRDDRRAEVKQSENWRKTIAKDMQTFVGSWLDKDISAETLLEALYLPHVAYWSYGERLPVFEDPGEMADLASLSASYARLARLIDSDFCWETINLSEDAYPSWLIERLEKVLADDTDAQMDISDPTVKKVASQSTAIAFSEQLIALSLGHYGPNAPQTLKIRRRHAQLCIAANDLGEARLQLEGAFYAWHHLADKADRAERTQCLRILRSVLQQMGDQEALKGLPEQDKNEEQRKTDEQEIINARRKAQKLFQQGDYVTARMLLEGTLNLAQKHLGPEDPAVLAHMSNLASTLREQGDYEGARELQTRVFKVLRRILGPEHPDVLAHMSELACILKAQGDLAGARRLQAQVLEVSRHVLGLENPATLASMSALASTLEAQGDNNGARKLLDQAIRANMHVLGIDHPNTLTSMNNLANILWSLGVHDDARKIQEQILEVRRRVLGPEHPDTLTSMSNLASTLRAQGDIDGARELQEQSLKARRRVLGPEHPKTLTSMNHLALTLGAQGDHAGARELLEQVLEVRRRVLGPEHPDTQANIENLTQFLKDSTSSGAT